MQAIQIYSLRGLASMVYKFFDKKSASLNKSSGSGVVNEPNYQLANELYKPIIKKFLKNKLTKNKLTTNIIKIR